MLAKSEPSLTAIRRSNDRLKKPSSCTLIGGAKFGNAVLDGLDGGVRIKVTAGTVIILFTRDAVMREGRATESAAAGARVCQKVSSDFGDEPAKEP
jgi:hypothetical protein